MTDEAQKKILELTEMSKRALADLANYKKRVEEERTTFAKFANLSLVLELLPVLDNLKRAVSQLPKELEENEWVKGIRNIEKQLEDVIQKQGVTEMQDPTGQPFNPHLHEAVLQASGAKDTVLEVLDKGYIFGDKVIRPAKVKVGQG